MTEAGGSRLRDEELAEVIDEILARIADGEAVDIDECIARYPEVADILQHGLPALQMIAGTAQKEPATAPSTEIIGDIQQLGDFKIIRELGRGGMGVVYEAEQLSLGRRVALKVLPFAALVSPDGIQRFHNEVRAAASLDHPNIVSVYFVGEERSVHFYAMQLIRGQSLSEILKQRSADTVQVRKAATDDSDHAVPGAAGKSTSSGQSNSSSQRQPGSSHETAPLNSGVAETLTGIATRAGFHSFVAGLGIQAASALHHAHERGIVHRDIKPANLLLDSAGQLFVTDFGLARIETDVAMTVTGDLIGTLRYMSPEQALGRQTQVDGRSDIYSLGATLYEILCHQPLFPGSDRRELLRQIATEEPQRLSKFAESIPADLETIIHTALAKAPEERYASAAALADDLQAFLDHRPIKAREPTTLQRVRKWVRRHQAVFNTAVVLVICMLAITSGLMWRSFDRESKLRSRAEHNAKEAQTYAAEARSLAERMKTLAAQEKQQRFEAQRLLYTADMKLASDAVRNGDIPRAASLLNRHRPGSGNLIEPGFEWYYLSRQVEVLPEWRVNVGSRVRRLRLSPSGLYLAVGTITQGVRIVDARSGHFLAQLWESTAINGVAWSPDEKQLATAAADGMIRIREFQQTGSGEIDFSRTTPVVQVMDGQTNPAELTTRDLEGEANDVLFDPTGSRLFTCGDDAFLRVWSLADGSETAVLKSHQRQIEGLAISESGSRLTSASSDVSTTVWDTDRLVPLQTIGRPTFRDRVTCTAIARNGRLCAAGDITGRIHVQQLNSDDASTQTLIDGVESVALLESPSRLITGDRGGSIQVRTLTSGSESAPHLSARPDAHWIAHSSRIDSLAVDHNRDLLFSGGREGTVAAWKVPTGGRPHEISSGMNCCFVPGGMLLVCGESIRLFKSDFSESNIVNVPPGGVWELVSCSLKASRVVVASRHVIAVIDLKDLTVKARWKVEGEVHRICLSPDGRYVAISWWDQVESIDIWAVDTPNDRRRFAARQCNCLAFSPDGSQLAAGNMDDVLLFDLTKANGPTRYLMAHDTTVQGIAYSPNGDFLATVSSDRHLKLWNVENAVVAHDVQAHRDDANYVSFSPDGSTLVTTGDDDYIRLWDSQSLQPLLEISVAGTSSGRRVEFSPDATRLTLVTGENLPGTRRIHVIPSR